MRLLEQRMIGSIEATPHTSNSIDMSQVTDMLVEITSSLQHRKYSEMRGAPHKTKYKKKKGKKEFLLWH